MCPGYFFNREKLRALSDASGGRVRRFCAESSVRLLDGNRLTPTNAIQAGEMHYNEGGASPYHLHKGTDANPNGADHVYMTFKGRGKVDVGETSQEIEPGTLVYFPPGVPHRLNAHGAKLLHSFGAGGPDPILDGEDSTKPAVFGDVNDSGTACGVE